MKRTFVIVTAVLLLAGCTSKPAAVSSAKAAPHETTDVFGKLGFAVAYDASVLKVETDKTMQFPHGADVYFVSRTGPQRSNMIPTSPDNVRVTVRRLPGYPKVTTAQVLKEWLSVEPLGSASSVRYHLTKLNGMPGVMFETASHGVRFLYYELYENGCHITIGAVATRKTAPWSALKSLAQSIRVTPGR